MSDTISAVQAKAHLAECIRRVEGGERLVITRNGRPVAALVAASDLARIERASASLPIEGLVGLVGRVDGDELADALDRVVAARSPTRAPPLD